VTTQQALLVAVGCGFGGMLGWGIADFLAKLTIDELGDMVSLLWAHVFGTLLLLCVAAARALFFGASITFPSHLSTWLQIAFFGVLQAMVYLLVYRGFGKGQVSVLNPVFASFSGLVALVSIVALGETATAGKLTALTIIFLGIMLLSIDGRAGKVRLLGAPGLSEVGLAAVCATAWTLGWGRLVSGNDWVVFALFMYAFMTVTVLLIALFQRVPLRVHNPAMWKWLVLIGLGEMVAYLSISLGYSSTTLTSIVAILSGAFSLPTIVLARIFLKERTAAIQAIGGGVVVGGIVILSLR
jgi:drug/metabolite transporter (DMT)-like permease